MLRIFAFNFFKLVASPEFLPNITAAPSLARRNTLSTFISNLSSLLQSTLNRVSALALLDFSRAFSMNKNFVSSDVVSGPTNWIKVNYSITVISVTSSHNKPTYLTSVSNSLQRNLSND